MLTVTGTMPSISGTVFEDMNVNGIVDGGEELAGVALRLFVDNGDGVYQPGVDDSQVGSATSDANGEYCFDGLDATLSYWVVQQSQTVNGTSLNQILTLSNPGDPRSSH